AITRRTTNSAASPQSSRARPLKSNANPTAATTPDARHHVIHERPSPMHNRSDLAVTRVRHPLKFRLLQVKQVRHLTPHLTRVTLTGDDLHDFESGSF